MTKKSCISLLLFSLVALMLLMLSSPVYAEVKEIIAEGTYTMGDGETPVVAEEQALLAAKRAAVEQAGTYVESYSATKNFQLTADEVKTIASGVMEVTVLDKNRTMVGNSINFWVKIKALVMTDKIEDMVVKLNESSATEDYQKLQEAYSSSQQEIAALKQQLAATDNENDKQLIRSQIAENETAFQANMWLDHGNRRMLNHEYNEAISAYSEAIAINPRLGRAYLKRGSAYSAIGQYGLAIGNYNAALEINPRLSLAYFGKGHAFEKLGQRREAVMAYRMFIESASSVQQRMVAVARFQIRQLEHEYYWSRE